MTINQDKVPVNLEEALVILKEGLSTEDLAEFKRATFTPSQLHFSIGMMLRNLWTLWDKDSRLVLWFRHRYGIEHADDISGLVLECLYSDMTGKPRRDDFLAKMYLDHWKKQD